MYENIQRGQYDVNGKVMYFRSRYEYIYACHLDFLKAQKQILDWKFESKVFEFEAIRHGTTRYIPDFEITELDGTQTYVEVKGFMDSRSKTKLKRMAKYYPKVKLVLIQADFIKSLLKQKRLFNIK